MIVWIGNKSLETAALAVVCPSCGVPVGEPCKADRTHMVRGDVAHSLGFRTLPDDDLLAGVE